MADVDNTSPDYFTSLMHRYNSIHQPGQYPVADAVMNALSPSDAPSGSSLPQSQYPVADAMMNAISPSDSASTPPSDALMQALTTGKTPAGQGSQTDWKSLVSNALSSEPEADAAIHPLGDLMSHPDKMNDYQSNTDPVTDMIGLLSSDEAPRDTPLPKEMLASKEQSSETATDPSGQVTGKVTTRDLNAAKGPNGKVLGLDTKSSLPIELNMGGQAFGTQQDLNDAQHRAANVEFANRLGKAAETFSAGLSHTQPVNQKSWEEGAQSGQNIVKDYQAQVANQKNDPNSPLSQAFRQYAQGLGVKINGAFTAADGEKLLPYMFKGFEADQQRQQTAANLEFKMKELAQMKQQHDETLAALKEKLGTVKTTGDQAKAMSEVTNKIEQSKSRGVVKNAYEAERLIDNAQSLINEYSQNGKNLNDMPQAQVANFFNELAKIAKGGVANESDYKHIAPNTLASRLMSHISSIGNTPTGADLGKFITENQPYLNSLKQNAMGVAGNDINNYLTGYKDRLSPQQYDTLKNLHGRYLKYAAPTEGTGKDVSQTMQYSPDVEQKIQNAIGQTGATRERVIQVLKANGVI